MQENRLRRQVREEKKRQLYTINVALIFILIYIILNLIFWDMGLLRYRRLRNTYNILYADVKALKDENAQLRNAIESFQRNDFLMERHAREDFGLAKPDEYIFIYDER